MANVEEHKLYKGRIIVNFYPDSHQYRIDGKVKTGVTSIIGIKDKSTALVSWTREETAKMAFDMLSRGTVIKEAEIIESAFASERMKEKAADLGTQIHDWCEQYINHKIKPTKYPMPEMPEDSNVVTGVTSFLQWESEHKVKFMWSERILYSQKHDYIGRADFAAKVDGLTCLCDLKSGNGLYNGVRMQTAAYAMADTEETKEKYDGRWAIRIAKETPAEYESRMGLKNRIKVLLGGKEREIEPYQVFEAKFLDNEKGAMKDDFEAFLAAWTLLKWDRRTDFYRNK